MAIISKRLVSSLTFGIPSTSIEKSQRFSRSRFASSFQHYYTTTTSTLFMKSLSGERPTLRGIVFDMDGTLTVPNIDFDELYRQCGVSTNDDILKVVKEEMSDEEAKRAWNIIDEFEAKGRTDMKLMPGTLELIDWFHAQGIPMSIVTRNTDKTLQHFFKQLSTPHTMIGLSRDNNDFPSKPHPASLIDIVQNKWSIPLPTQDVLMIGDSVSNDVVFGNTAGVATVLFLNPPKQTNEEEEKDPLRIPTKTISNLWELPQWLWNSYKLLGPIGTDVPPLKYATPQPQSQASKAAFHNDLSTLKQLVSPEQIIQKDDNHNTPLIWAVEAGHLHIVDFLLSIDEKIMITTTDNHNNNDDDVSTDQSPSSMVEIAGYLGATAIHRAVRAPNLLEILQTLLQHLSTHQRLSMSINQPNDKLQYPLHIAAFHCNVKAVELLLQYGANPLVLDRKGRTPDQDTSDTTIQQIILQSRPKYISNYGQPASN